MTSQNNPRLKGTLMLSMPRSGTNWLKSIGDATGRMGATDEWLGFETLDKPPRAYTAQSYYDRIVQQASTANGRFAVKIFPHHVRQARQTYNFDFIQKCVQENDVKLYLITREDRLGQAISRLKATQTQTWTEGTGRSNAVIRYNFRKLCSFYFEAGRGYDFWRSYLAINGYQYEAFTYEELLPNPAPFFESAAAHLGVAPPESYESSLKIQRDSVTEVWRQRFLDDIATQGIHPDTYDLPQPDASLSNALKVFAGRRIKPSKGNL